MKVYALKYKSKTNQLFGVCNCQKEYSSIRDNSIIELNDHEKYCELELLTSTPLITTDKAWLKSFIHGNAYYNGKLIKLMIYSLDEMEIVELTLG